VAGRPGGAADAALVEEGRLLAFGHNGQTAYRRSFSRDRMAGGSGSSSQGTDRVDEGAFVRYPTSQVGGNINPYTFPGRRPAINLDCGVLDVSHPAMSKVPSWSQASLRDRIEAAVAHEYTEALAKPMPGLSFHDQALKFAPETALDISPAARQILREYRTAMGLD